MFPCTVCVLHVSALYLLLLPLSVESLDLFILWILTQSDAPTDGFLFLPCCALSYTPIIKLTFTLRLWCVPGLFTSAILIPVAHVGNTRWVDGVLKDTEKPSKTHMMHFNGDFLNFKTLVSGDRINLVDIHGAHCRSNARTSAEIRTIYRWQVCVWCFPCCLLHTQPSLHFVHE